MAGRMKRKIIRGRAKKNAKAVSKIEKSPIITNAVGAMDPEAAPVGKEGTDEVCTGQPHEREEKGLSTVSEDRDDRPREAESLIEWIDEVPINVIQTLLECNGASTDGDSTVIRDRFRRLKLRDSGSEGSPVSWDPEIDGSTSPDMDDLSDKEARALLREWVESTPKVPLPVRDSSCESLRPENPDDDTRVATSGQGTEEPINDARCESGGLSTTPREEADASEVDSVVRYRCEASRKVQWDEPEGTQTDVAHCCDEEETPVIITVEPSRRDMSTQTDPELISEEHWVTTRREIGTQTDLGIIRIISTHDVDTQTKKKRKRRRKRGRRKPSSESIDKYAITQDAKSQERKNSDDPRRKILRKCVCGARVDSDSSSSSRKARNDRKSECRVGQKRRWQRGQQRADKETEGSQPASRRSTPKRRRRRRRKRRHGETNESEQREMGKTMMKSDPRSQGQEGRFAEQGRGTNSSREYATNRSPVGRIQKAAPQSIVVAQPGKAESWIEYDKRMRQSGGRKTSGSFFETQTRRRTSTPPFCFNCGGPSHYARDCDQPRVQLCKGCGRKNVTNETCGCAFSGARQSHKPWSTSRSSAGRRTTTEESSSSTPHSDPSSSTESAEEVNAVELATSKNARRNPGPQTQRSSGGKKAHSPSTASTTSDARSSSPGQGSFARRLPPFCFNCGEKGHSGRGCTNQRVELCFGCGRKGVTNETCGCAVTKNENRTWPQRGSQSTE